MKTRLRQVAPTLVLLVFLMALTSVATYWQLRQEVDYPALATSSSQPDGARALYLWAQELGYDVAVDTPGIFSAPERAGIAFILEPELPGVSAAEWQTLEPWIEDGGTLFLVGDGLGAALSMQHVEFNVAYRERLGESEVQIVENIFSITPEALSNVRPRAVLQSERVDYSILLIADGEPLAVAIERGEGMVILSTLAYPLTNQGLKDPGNPQFSLGLLTLAGETGTMWFDEWHHGVRNATASMPSGLGHWLRVTRSGQAILYSAAIIFLWLVLSGKRFGRPIPQREHARRRASAEQVMALANLSRRAGHRYAIRDHYHRELKQQLGRRYGLSPAVPDDEFLRRLIAIDPDLDQGRLNVLLKALDGEEIGERRLLQLAQEVSEWIRL